VELRALILRELAVQVAHDEVDELLTRNVRPGVHQRGSEYCMDGSGASVPRRMGAALLQQLGDEAGPAGLVAGPHAPAVVAVEVFVERDQVLPLRVVLEAL